MLPPSSSLHRLADLISISIMPGYHDLNKKFTSAMQMPLASGSLLFFMVFSWRMMVLRKPTANQLQYPVLIGCFCAGIAGNVHVVVRVTQPTGKRESCRCTFCHWASFLDDRIVAGHTMPLCPREKETDPAPESSPAGIARSLRIHLLTATSSAHSPPL